MPRTETERDYYTVAQAADVLNVSATTVWRWIKADLLPAYRAGPRNIRIKKEDLQTALSPARPAVKAEAPQALENGRRQIGQVPAKLEIRPLTDDEVRRGLQALEEARELRTRMLAEHNGQPLTSSVFLIRRARDEQSKRLQ